MNGNHLILHSPLGVIVAFGAGLISFLSPCVLPLVPSYLSMMSGLGTAELDAATGAKPKVSADAHQRVAAGASTGAGSVGALTGAGPAGADGGVEAANVGAMQRKLLRSTLLFVAGFTVVFALLEATASTAGQALQHHQQGLNEVAGVVILVMGLMFAGLLRPAWLLKERRLHVSPSKLGPWAAPVMGMAFAFGWTPCIGPALGAVLSLASTTHTLLRGELMLVAYSLGLGVPFVIAGVAFGRLSGLFGWAKRHVRAINVVSGLLLAALGVLLLTGNLHWLSTWVSDLLNAIGLGRLSTV